ncbi:hypothetical protein KAZ57_02585 [Patescibacteria group bacterium]|nr:hypothetical protein [Patescibacteria group bacterium]
MRARYVILAVMLVCHGLAYFWLNTPSMRETSPNGNALNVAVFVVELVAYFFITRALDVPQTTDAVTVSATEGISRERRVAIDLEMALLPSLWSRGTAKSIKKFLTVVGAFPDDYIAAYGEFLGEQVWGRVDYEHRKLIEAATRKYLAENDVFIIDVFKGVPHE